MEIPVVIEGKKFDEGKLDYTLIDPLFKKKLAEVLEHGREKYAAHSWMDLPNGRARYIKALVRHLEEYLAGNKYDRDSKLEHLAHLACNAMFILHLDAKNHGMHVRSWPFGVMEEGNAED